MFKEAQRHLGNLKKFAGLHIEQRATLRAQNLLAVDPTQHLSPRSHSETSQALSHDMPLPQVSYGSMFRTRSCLVTELAAEAVVEERTRPADPPGRVTETSGTIHSAPLAEASALAAASPLQLATANRLRSNNLTITPENLAGYVSQSLRSGKTGISHDVIMAMLTVCKRLDIILAIRPVSPFAKTLIEDLIYPTKPFVIKAKTAKFGIAAGHIVYNPDDEAHQRYVNNHHATVLPLLVTGQRVDELEQSRTVCILDGEGMVLPEADSAQQVCRQITVACTNTGQLWVLNLAEAGHASYLNEHTRRGGVWSVHCAHAPGVPLEPVKVLAHPELKRPFTSDYDLLTFGARPSASRSKEQLRKPPLTMEDIGTLRGTLNALGSQAGRSPSGSSAGSTATLPGFDSLRPEGMHAAPRVVQSTSNAVSEDPQWGNASPILKGIVQVINNLINRGKNQHLQLIHHNADCHNPYSNESGNYPALFLLPNAAASGKINIDANPETVGQMGELTKLLSPSRPRDSRHNTGLSDLQPLMWIDNYIDFNSLAEAAMQRGYEIYQNPRWLGGSVVRKRTLSSSAATFL